MNDLIEIPLCLGAGSGYSAKSNASVMNNLYISKEEYGAKTEYVILNREGSLQINKTDTEIFGIYEFLEFTYLVTATELLRLERIGGEFIKVANVEFSDHVSFSDNGITMMMVDGTKGFAYTAEGQAIKDMDTEEGWFISSTVDFMDGYFIFNRDGTGQFFISKLYSTELNPLDWATGESAPDDTLAVLVSNRVLWVMGEKTVEAWYDSGDADFPFTRVSGGTILLGVATHRSVVKVKDKVFFLGDDFKVYEITGYTPSGVSTTAVEKQIAEVDSADIRCFSFSSEGHWFYVMQLSDHATYVYDITVGVWHTRETGDSGVWHINNAFNRSKQNSPIGYAGNKVYSLNIRHFTDNGEPIKREIITLPINSTVNRVTISEVILDMEVSLEENAEIALYTSKDAGRTWSNRNPAYTGKTGEHLNRVRWQRLGQFRDCILKIVTFAEVRIRIIGLHIRVGR